MARVFLSHSSQDRTFVETLAIRLNKAGLDVWYDKWEIRVGDSIVERIEEGISRSDFLVVVLSKHSVASPWVRKELDAGTAREIERRGAFIIPVLAETCDIPPLLSGKRYANFEISPDRAFEELLEAVVSRSPTVHDANRLTEVGAGPMTVETMQLYTSATGNDFTVYQGEEERGLDHVTQECERRLALLCALLVNQTDVRADQFSREKGLAFQKIGYPMGSLSCSIARSQDEFLQWDAEIVAEIKCEGYDDITRTLVSAFVLMDGIKWEGVRYLASAVVDDIAALRLCKEHGFPVIRYLPTPSSLLQLKIPSWTFKKYKWSDTERVTTTVVLEQLSQSRLRIEIQFHDRFPEPTGWPDGDCWNVLQPSHVLQQFAATLRDPTA